MIKLKIFLIFLIILSINTNVSSKTKENHYIILDNFQNFDKARLNRAKLSTLSNAKIIILSPKQTIKTKPAFTPGSVQKAKLMEHFYAFKKINKKEPLENKKKENTNFLTIDPKDFNLPHVDEKKISPPSK